MYDFHSILLSEAQILSSCGKYMLFAEVLHWATHHLYFMLNFPSHRQQLDSFFNSFAPSQIIPMHCKCVEPDRLKFYKAVWGRQNVDVKLLP